MSNPILRIKYRNENNATERAALTSLHSHHVTLHLDHLGAIPPRILF
jgi:hypothetical protein